MSPPDTRFLRGTKSSSGTVQTPDDYYFDLDAGRDPNIKTQPVLERAAESQSGRQEPDRRLGQFPKVTSGRNRSSKAATPHPAQFPVAVIERIIKACCRPGGLVLDPFLGSGTTAEVAMRLGRPVVGFEIEPRYVEIAAERLGLAAGQILATEIS